MTADIALPAATLRPGQPSLQKIASTYTPRGARTMCPSPRYEAKQVCVCRLVDGSSMASWTLGPAVIATRGTAAAAAPVPDGGDRYPADLRVLPIEDANRG